jgi:hypothetical protein
LRHHTETVAAKVVVESHMMAAEIETHRYMEAAGSMALRTVFAGLRECRMGAAADLEIGHMSVLECHIPAVDGRFGWRKDVTVVEVVDCKDYVPYHLVGRK